MFRLDSILTSVKLCDKPTRCSDAIVASEIRLCKKTRQHFNEHTLGPLSKSVTRLRQRQSVPFADNLDSKPKDRLRACHISSSFFEKQTRLSILTSPCSSFRHFNQSILTFFRSQCYLFVSDRGVKKQDCWPRVPLCFNRS